MTRRFEDLIRQLSESVRADYEEARRHTRNKDPQRAGHEGEGTWQRVLEAWGPGWPVVTRKYIVGPGGETNEVDVLLLKPTYPAPLLGQPSVMASGVAAAFSCKLTLRRNDLREALTQKARINDVAGRPNQTVRESLCGTIPFGLLAHSMDFSGAAQRDPSHVLQEAYEQIAHELVGGSAAEGLVTHPADELDALLVADASFLQTMRVAFGLVAPRGPSTSFNMPSRPPDRAGTPLAQFLVWLEGRCGTDALASLSAAFRARESQGLVTNWPIDIYAEHIKADPGRYLLNEHGHSLIF